MSDFRNINAAEDYPSVSGPCRLSFPRDHGSHPDYRIEWWYYTGNLRSEEGERYGFQLTFFRIRTAPASAEKDWPKKPSAWRTDQVFAAHAALSDVSSKQFYHSEKMSRAALKLAGTREQDDRLEVFVNGWMAALSPEAHNLTAAGPSFSIDLELVPRKSPVLHGDSGYTKKGDGPEEASCYYSIPRFDAAGKILLGGREVKVHGAAWMDHEFSSAPLGDEFAGWDWFSLQFSDGSELMVYLMRKKSGEFSAVSSGTYVDKEGKALSLSCGDFRIKVLSTWRSGISGAVYPASWGLEVLPLDLRVNITPNIADQEMQSPGSTRVTYWEGSVRVEGTVKNDLPLTGEGYAELTGYAGTVAF